MLAIGILGAAGIAPAAVLLPARRRDDTAVVAVASRTGADAYAERHGIPKAYGSYAELLQDPDIDLVYNALPPSAHAEWTIAALRAGKDVLCEKPFTMTASEAARVVEVAEQTGRRVIEAFHDHYHPLSAWLRQTVASGVLGRLTRAEAVFNGANPFVPGSIRHEPALGGGALMDLGCYPVHWVRTLFGEPDRVVAATTTNNPLGADFTVEADLRFADGLPVVVRASMLPDVALESSITIEGERGVLHVENLVFPSAGHSIRLELDGLPQESTVAGLHTYDHQLEAVVDALRTGRALPTEGADSVANMALIDAIYAAAGFDRPWR
jgi:predicted dehydrogenase